MSLLEGGHELAPHGYCLLWDPALVWTHVISDALIAGAYFSIPVALVYFVRKRRDVEFGWMLWLFALFIIACGLTHLLSIWTLWHADYVLEGVVKAITAIASVATAVLLWPLVPRLMAIPSPVQLSDQRDQLARALERLTEEMGERKRAEEALRQSHKMEAVGQLTGGIAHDFNNLLQAVTGSLDMIARQPTSEKVEKWASLGLRAAERGARVTAQLLAFSRTQKLELRPITVAPLLEGMRELLNTAVGPAVRIDYDLDNGDPVNVLADPTQIELAVLNLAINARDAMGGGGTITIRTEPVEIQGDPSLEDGRYLCLSVADTGAGMPADVQARAFDPFFTTKGPGKGTGLGLSMVYGVARQSGGRAEIESEPGRGTKVSIMLKIVDEPAGAVTPEDAAEEAQRPMCVLLVDDDEDVRAMTATMLQGLGHRIAEADSGQAALQCIDEVEPDIIVMDFAMPGLSGAQTAEQLRSAGYDTPILFASGFADTDALIAAVGEDMPLLRKPFSLSELSRALQAALRRRQAGRTSDKAAE